MPIVRVDDLVKDRRPPEAAALCAVLDKIINTNRNAVQAIKAAFSAPLSGWQGGFVGKIQDHSHPAR
jgi:hypothetical protein